MADEQNTEKKELVPAQTTETPVASDQKPQPRQNFTEDQQAHIERIVAGRLARERGRQEKQLAQAFGTTDLGKISSFYQAGQAVSRSSGTSPSAILARLKGTGATVQGGANSVTPPVAEADVLRDELTQIKTMLYAQQEERNVANEEEKARGLYGQLYEDNKFDIVDLSTEKGLKLDEAAAILLAPKLPKYYTKQQQKKLLDEQNRAVEGSDQMPEGVARATTVVLEPLEKEIARRLGLTQKEYAWYKENKNVPK